MSGSNRQKLIILGVVLLLITMGLVGNAQLAKVQTNYNLVTDQNSPKLIVLEELNAESFHIVSISKSIALSSVTGGDNAENQAQDAELAQSLDSFDETLSRYRALSGEQTAFAQQLEERGQGFRAVSSRMTEIRDQGGSTDDLTATISELENADEAFDAVIESAIESEASSLETATETASARAESATVLNVASTIAAALLTIIFGVIIDRQNRIRAKLEKERVDLLAQTNRDLEAKVAERTSELVSLNSELTKARDEALAASRLKTDFLASMSHELRTPLNAILNFTEMVGTGMTGPVNDEQKSLLDMSLDSAQHLLELINDVLDMSKIQAGMLDIFVEQEVDLQKELDSVIATAEALISGKPVTFIKDIDPQLPRVFGDKRRIRQILLNLISNAAKFTREGTITLRVKQVDHQVAFTVTDTGAGIAPGDLETIFEPFVQTDEGMKVSGGTGLGLPISQWLARAHGGNITVESKQGEGATFHVALPIVHTETPAPAGNGQHA